MPTALAEGKTAPIESRSQLPTQCRLCQREPSCEVQIAYQSARACSHPHVRISTRACTSALNNGRSDHCNSAPWHYQNARPECNPSKSPADTAEREGAVTSTRDACGPSSTSRDLPPFVPSPSPPCRHPNLQSERQRNRSTHTIDGSTVRRSAC
jgi:hypothetical protein